VVPPRALIVTLLCRDNKMMLLGGAGKLTEKHHAPM
jgi:hypothetical protein